MNLTIEIPDEIGVALKAEAQAEGMSVAAYASRVIEKSLGTSIEGGRSGPPFETGYGSWAKYGSAPSAEEIREIRREMFRSFAKDV